MRVSIAQHEMNDPGIKTSACWVSNPTPFRFLYKFQNYIERENCLDRQLGR
jgi:hypothetical protein